MQCRQELRVKLKYDERSQNRKKFFSIYRAELMKIKNNIVGGWYFQCRTFSVHQFKSNIYTKRTHKKKSQLFFIWINVCALGDVSRKIMIVMSIFEVQPYSELNPK